MKSGLFVTLWRHEQSLCLWQPQIPSVIVCSCLFTKHQISGVVIFLPTCNSKSWVDMTSYHLPLVLNQGLPATVCKKYLKAHF